MVTRHADSQPPAGSEEDTLSIVGDDAWDTFVARIFKGWCAQNAHTAAVPSGIASTHFWLLCLAGVSIRLARRWTFLWRSASSASRTFS